MSQLDEAAVVKAYAEVEKLLSESISACASKEAFIETLMRHQLIAQRTLGVLLFNAVKSAPKITFEEQFKRVTDGIKREFDQLTEAEAQDESTLTSVDADFGSNNALN